jgi:hypothetical protein
VGTAQKAELIRLDLAGAATAVCGGKLPLELLDDNATGSSRTNVVC